VVKLWITTGCADFFDLLGAGDEVKALFTFDLGDGFLGGEEVEGARAGLDFLLERQGGWFGLEVEEFADLGKGERAEAVEVTEGVHNAEELGIVQQVCVAERREVIELLHLAEVVFDALVVDGVSGGIVAATVLGGEGIEVVVLALNVDFGDLVDCFG